MHSLTRNVSLSVASMAAVMSIALSTPNIAGAAPPGDDPGTSTSTSTQTPPTTDPTPSSGQTDDPATEQPTAPPSTSQAPTTSQEAPPTSDTPSSDTPAPSTSTPPVKKPQARAAVAAGCQTYPPTSYQVCGVIRDKYNQMNGPNSFLLFPKSNELTNPNNTGKRSEFLGGNIYWSTATGAHPVAHDFLTKWGEKGYEGGYLKYPTTDEIPISGGINGRRQEYQGGSIYFEQTAGAHTIQGAIKDKWVALGAQTGALGYPTGDEVVTPDGKGRFNKFQNGSIYWSPTTGAHVITGLILDQWAQSGYEGGPYGYPTGDTTAVQGESGSFRQVFQFGSIYVRSDGYVRGIRTPADSGFQSFDVGLHPGYPEVDLSNYDSVGASAADKAVNNANAQNVQAAMATFGWTNARALWEHFYENTGSDSRLDQAAIDDWSTSSSSFYSDAPPASQTVIANRNETIAAAIAEADRTGKATKTVIASPWIVTGAEGDLTDYRNSLGHYSLNSTTAVIAQPGTAGNHQIELRQQVHVYDVYDFDMGSSGGFGAYGNEVGYAGIIDGTAKPFLDFGSGGTSSFSGVR